MSQLYVHRSQRAEDLVAGLAELLAAPAGDVFARDAVVVHSRGLERWLAMQVAWRNGICAQTDFLTPHRLVGLALATLLGPDADAGAWTAERIRWAVLGALPEIVDTPAGEPLRSFLTADAPDDPPALGSRRAVGLAHAVGGLFERYATYRPDLVASWRTGAGDGWEPPLWRAVAGRLPGSDLGELHAALTDALEAGADPAALPARIAVFSVVTLPPITVELLAALARIRPVHVFVLSPTDSIWTGAPATHPLLASMGSLITTFVQTLLRHDPVVADLPAPPPEPDSLLHALQRDLRANALPGSPPVLDPADRSVQLHGCHTPTRQVQVLRHVLLDLFDADPTLQPRDVIVMAPEIADWAPLIRGVFGDGEVEWARRNEHPGRLPRLPYGIADRGLGATNPFADALLRTLRLAGTRLKASAVLDLLDVAVVRDAFGIAADDLPALRELVIGAGARWGADAAHRARFDQPETDLYTWRHALDRLLMGHAVADQGDLVLDVLPHGDVEGRDGRALLGGLVDLVEVLIDAALDFEEARSVAGWRDALLALFERICAPAPDDEEAEEVRAGLVAIAEDAAAAEWSGAIDRSAVESLLDGRFTVAEPGRGYLSGGITFCRMTPMRSVPFRVVVLLGMDDGVFPRRSTRLAVDRMDAEPQPGDRSPREDDRALFLESILSARDAFIVTWTGSSPYSDRTFAPATPVAELLDVLDHTAVRPDGASVADAVVTRHPLHAFSPHACDPAAPFTFDARDATQAKAWRQGRLAPEPVPPLVGRPLGPIDLSARPATPRGAVDSLDVGALSWFFADPIEAFFRRLGLYDDDEVTELADREPARLENGLPAWAVTDALTRAALDGGSLELGGPAWQRLRAGPLLPLGMPGEQAFLAAAGVARELADRVRAATHGDALPPQRICVHVRGVDIVGQVDGLRDPAERLVWRAGRPRDRYVLDLWIHHVLLCANGWSGTSRMVARGHDVLFRPVPHDAADTMLSDLVLLWEVGQALPLLFFPEPSREWAEAVAEGVQDPDLRRWPPRSYDCPRLPLLLGSRNPFAPWFDPRGLVPSPALTAPALADRVWGQALRFLVLDLGGTD